MSNYFYELPATELEKKNRNIDSSLDLAEQT